jgi:hypothetical protein
MLEQNPARRSGVPDRAFPDLTGVPNRNLATWSNAALDLIGPIRSVEEDVRPTGNVDHLPHVRNRSLEYRRRSYTPSGMQDSQGLFWSQGRSIE